MTPLLADAEETATNFILWTNGHALNARSLVHHASPELHESMIAIRSVLAELLAVDVGRLVPGGEA